VAETFEQAQAAASEIKVTYSEKKPDVRTELSVRAASGEVQPLEHTSDRGTEPNQPAPPESKRGKPDEAFEAAQLKLDETYETPV